MQPDPLSCRTAVLQIRLGSRRLPGKGLMPVLGRPILLFNIERILMSRSVDRVIVATSDQPTDDPIERLCKKEGIPIFRGSEDDVLDRLYRCVCAFDLPVLIRFGADNPLVDPDVNDRVIQYYFDHACEYDYVSNNHPPSYPNGLELEVISRPALEVAWRESKAAFQREHGTPFIWDQPERFRIGNVALEDNHLYRERWTLDFPEDIELIRRVFEALYPQKRDFRMADVLALLDRQPELRSVNSKYADYIWYNDHVGVLRTIVKRDAR